TDCATGETRPHRDLVFEFARPENRRQVAGVDLDLARNAFGDLHRDAAEHAADRALEIAYARFACVVGDDRVDRVVRELALLSRETVRFELTLDQIALRD